MSQTEDIAERRIAEALVSRKADLGAKVGPLRDREESHAEHELEPL